MRLRYSFILAGVLGLISQIALAEKITLGRVETGLIGDQCIHMRIRMDTGAKTSSVSAHNIKIIEKDQQQWVQFILDPDRTPTIYQFELPLVRMVKIRKRAAEAKSGELFERRPIVTLPLTLGQETHQVEVSLADRSYFNYGMLMGRTAMDQFQAMIDPGLSFTTKPVCPSEKNIVD